MKKNREGSVFVFFLVVSFLRLSVEVIWDDDPEVVGRGAAAKSSCRTRDTFGAGAFGYPEFGAESRGSLEAQAPIQGGRSWEPCGCLRHSIALSVQGGWNDLQPSMLI